MPSLTPFRPQVQYRKKSGFLRAQRLAKIRAFLGLERDSWAGHLCVSPAPECKNNLPSHPGYLWALPARLPSVDGVPGGSPVPGWVGPGLHRGPLRVGAPRTRAWAVRQRCCARGSELPAAGAA